MVALDVWTLNELIRRKTAQLQEAGCRDRRMYLLRKGLTEDVLFR